MPSQTQHQPLKLALLTPSYNRAQFLAQCHRYAGYQQVASDVELRWFVLDDSPKQTIATWQQEAWVDYVWSAERIILGAKRNQLNQRALDWGADYCFALDDDDWYSEHYVQQLLDLLQQSGQPVVGSEQMCFYDVATGKMGKTHHIHGNTTCNNLMAYSRAHALARRYADDAKSGEEPAFIRGVNVAQHSQPEQLHMMLIHPHNTVSKRNYVRDPRCLMDLCVEDLPMQAQDRPFYRDLTERHQQIQV